MWTPLFADAALRHPAAGRGHAGDHGRRAGRRLAARHDRRDLPQRICARHRVREIVKPILELLGAVPTVVYGYFALHRSSRRCCSGSCPDLPGFNMLSAGHRDGHHDHAVRQLAQRGRDARRAAAAARRLVRAGRQRACRRRCGVVVPGAFSGIAAAFILGISRAIGETMIVAIAAGHAAATSRSNPREPAETITAYIVQVSLGDLPHGSIGYQSIFAAGLVLFADDAGLQHRRLSGCARVPGGVLMSAIGPTCAKPADRGRAAASARHSSSAARPGRACCWAWRCWSSLLDRPACATALPRFDWHFFTNFAVAARRAEAGILSRLGRHRC